LTFSGYYSGSAEVIPMISLESSSVVNDIEAILSKHFLKWPCTAWGFLV